MSEWWENAVRLCGCVDGAEFVGVAWFSVEALGISVCWVASSDSVVSEMEIAGTDHGVAEF